MTDPLVEAAHRFCRVAQSARLTDAESVGSDPFRFERPWMFRLSPELRKAETALGQSAATTLGVLLGSEREAIDLAWKILAEAPTQTSPAFAVALDKVLRDKSRLVSRFVTTNCTIRLQPGVPSFSIGPVHVRRSEDILSEVNAKSLLIFSSAMPDTTRSPANPADVRLGSICWDISLLASHHNAKESALWMIDTATSILRLLWPRTIFEPTVGENTFKGDNAEWHPWEHPFRFPPYAEFSDDGSVRLGPGSALRVYPVTKALIEALNHIAFADKANGILCASPNTIGEQIASGCAWLTRGRRLSDRSQRFVAFFTSLEALFASEGSRGGSTDAIARGVACVMSDDPAERVKWNKVTRDLYRTRSEIVHRGERSASQYHVDDLMLICEEVYFRVIEHCSMTESKTNFQKRLVRCSFGAKFAETDI